MAFWPDKFVFALYNVYIRYIFRWHEIVWIIGRMVLNLLTLSFFDTIWLFCKLHSAQRNRTCKTTKLSRTTAEKKNLQPTAQPYTSNQCQTCRTVAKIIETVKWNKNANGSWFEKLFTNSFVRWLNFFPLFFFIKLHVYIDLKVSEREKPFTLSKDSIISMLPVSFCSIRFCFDFQFNYYRFRLNIGVFAEELVGQMQAIDKGQFIRF